MRFRAFPFSDAVVDFIESHEILFLAEQNRDAQMKTLLVNELGIDPNRIVSVLYFGGFSISADTIHEQVIDYFETNNLARLEEVRS